MNSDPIININFINNKVEGINIFKKIGVYSEINKAYDFENSYATTYSEEMRDQGLIIDVIENGYNNNSIVNVSFNEFSDIQ